MAVNGVQSQAQDTYKSNYLISQTSRQQGSSALDASEAFLKRKIAERQEQKAEQEQEFAARLEISQEAQDAWKTKSYKEHSEDKKTTDTEDNRKYFADYYSKQSQNTKQTSNNSGRYSNVGSKLDIVA